MSSVSDSIDDLNLSVAALYYYQYRIVGCPYGDSMSGLTAWIDIQKEAFEKLADPTGEDDATP